MHEVGDESKTFLLPLKFLTAFLGLLVVPIVNIAQLKTILARSKKDLGSDITLEPGDRVVRGSCARFGPEFTRRKISGVRNGILPREPEV